MVDDELRFGVPPRTIQPPPEALRGAIGVRWVETLWLEVPIGDGWVAAYRLIPQDGVPVVAELRVFPGALAPGATARDAGRWPGEVLGNEAAALVPRGGLTARRLRGVSLWEHRRAAQQILEETYRQHADTVFAGEDLLGVSGLTRKALAHLRRPGGRRRRWTEADYARVAAAYVEALRTDPTRPAVATARALSKAGLRISAAQVADLVHRARTLDLLTPAPKHGASGGMLTDKARKLLVAGDEQASSAEARGEPKRERKSKGGK